jgi:hypothetical protein
LNEKNKFYEKNLEKLENSLTCDLNFQSFDFADGSDKFLYNISGNLISFTADDKWTSLFSNKEIEKVSFSFFFIIC